MLALKYMFVQVDCTLMVGEVSLNPEPHAALITLMRFLAGMNQHVLLEVTLLGECCPACIAHMRLQLAMHSILVLLQVPFRPEPHITRLERARMVES